jgi:hypothetical protein
MKYIIELIFSFFTLFGVYSQAPKVESPKTEPARASQIVLPVETIEISSEPEKPLEPSLELQIQAQARERELQDLYIDCVDTNFESELCNQFDYEFEFGQPAMLTSLEWSEQNYSGIAKWKNRDDRYFYIAHNYNFPGLEHLNQGDQVKIGDESFKIKERHIKDNSTTEAYEFTKNRFELYQLQTCLDDKLVVIYDLELVY